MTLNYFMKILDKNNLLAPKNGYFRILFLWEERGGIIVQNRNRSTTKSPMTKSPVSKAPMTKSPRDNIPHDKIPQGKILM